MDVKTYTRKSLQRTRNTRKFMFSICWHALNCKLGFRQYFLFSVALIYLATDENLCHDKSNTHTWLKRYVPIESERVEKLSTFISSLCVCEEADPRQNGKTARAMMMMMMLVMLVMLQRNAVKNAVWKREIIWFNRDISRRDANWFVTFKQ